MSAAATAMPLRRRGLPRALAEDTRKAEEAWKQACKRRQNRGGWSQRPEASFRAAIVYGDANSKLLALLEWKTIGSAVPEDRQHWVELSTGEAADILGMDRDTIGEAAHRLETDGVIVSRRVQGRTFYRLDWEKLDSLEPPARRPKRKPPIKLVAAPKPEEDVEVEEVAEIAPAAPKASLRVLPTTEPLVILPGQNKPRPLSEVCKGNCSLRTKGEFSINDGTPTSSKQTIWHLNKPEISGLLNGPAARAWKAASEYIRQIIAWEGYESWVAGLQAVELADGILLVACPTQGHRAMVHDLCEGIIPAAAKAARVKRLRFEVMPDLFEAEPESPAPERPAALFADLRKAYPAIRDPVPADLPEAIHQILHTSEEYFLRSATSRERRDIRSWGVIRHKAVDAVLSNLQEQGHNVGWLPVRKS